LTPYSGLLQGSDGLFYGTTQFNGGAGGQGTIFKVDSAGNFTTLYSFPDDSEPMGSLVEGADGNFYGTTSAGGTNGVGSVFQITPGGVLTTLHSFSGSDGANPAAGLILASDGYLYGTTPLGGGAAGEGTIFKIDYSGSFTSLYAYGNDAEPWGGVVEGSDGNFYGTTEFGGASAKGSVFQLTPAGVHTRIYSFSGSDGKNPVAGLILASDGYLYGTTEFGGSAGGEGTVFKIDYTGTFTSLYSFPSGADPHDGVVEGTDGNFYGTTYFGGASAQGSVFQVTPSGVHTLIHSFSGPDGQNLTAGLIQGADGRLYGTASAGGPDGGIAFSICYPDSAPPPVSANLCVTPSTPGNLASVPSVAGDSYAWTLVGGTIDSGQGTNQISFTSGPTGSLMTLSIVESNSAGCEGRATVTLETNFADVASTSPFYQYICQLARDSITGGCGGGNFCPTSPVLRSQMAVFLLRAEHGAAYVPPACLFPTFPDVPCSNPFSSWIDELVAEGITGGCAGGDFCPGNAVLRNSMAVFLLVTEHGIGYTPPACTPPGQFTDVPCPGGGFTNFIYQLVAEGITGGCTATTYCPTQPVNRAQMSVFLVVTFSLP
jgi:uncharacterized repeat protein (TIGR03803 family)